MTTLVEQLFQRWKRASDDYHEKADATELAERAQSDARWVRKEAAELLHKALGERRVLIGDRVVWTVREDHEVWVRSVAVITPEQVEPEKP
jgi:hypothetical protein